MGSKVPSSALTTTRRPSPTMRSSCSGRVTRGSACAQRADGAGHVAQAHVALEQLARGAQGDEVLERVRPRAGLGARGRDDLRAVERAQARLGHAEELGDLAAREEVGDRLAPVGRGGDAGRPRPRRSPVDSPMRPPPEPKATWMTSSAAFAALVFFRRRSGSCWLERVGSTPSRHAGARDVPSLRRRAGPCALYQRRLDVDVNPHASRIGSDLDFAGEAAQPAGRARRGLAVGHAHGAEAHVDVATGQDRRAIAGSLPGTGRMRLVEPYQMRPPTSSRAQPSLMMSARSKSSRQRGSEARRSVVVCARTNGSPRALASQGVSRKRSLQMQAPGIQFRLNGRPGEPALRARFGVRGASRGARRWARRRCRAASTRSTWPARRACRPPGASPTLPTLMTRTPPTMRSKGTWLAPQTTTSAGSSPMRALISSSLMSCVSGSAGSTGRAVHEQQLARRLRAGRAEWVGSRRMRCRMSSPSASRVAACARGARARGRCGGAAPADRAWPRRGR